MSSNGCFRLFSMIILCMITHVFMTSHVWAFDQVRARYHTIANWVWSIPNECSTSFLQASWLWANYDFFPPNITLECLHKCWLSWINGINQVVSFVVVVAIDRKVNQGSMTFNKSKEYIRALQYVDVIVRFSHRRKHAKSLPLPQVLHCKFLWDLCTCLGKQMDSSYMFNACNRCYQASYEIPLHHFVTGSEQCLMH
jgi:hypothetical protein